MFSDVSLNRFHFKIFILGIRVLADLGVSSNFDANFTFAGCTSPEFKYVCSLCFTIWYRSIFKKLVSELFFHLGINCPKSSPRKICYFVSKPEIQHHGVFEGFWKQGIFGLRKSLCQNPGSDGWYTDQEHGQWAPDARQLRDPGRAQPKYSAGKCIKLEVYWNGQKCSLKYCSCT